MDVNNKDDIVWVLTGNANFCLAFSVNTPYLYPKDTFRNGKLMYATTAPFENESIALNDRGKQWYKVAYSINNKVQIPKSDEEILSVGSNLGLKTGIDLDRSLSRIPDSDIYSIIPSGKPCEVIHDFCEQNSQNLFTEISDHYEINNDDIKIAGGLSLFPKRLDEAHDIDVVIPINSELILNKLLTNPCPAHGKEVFEFGKYWPLRWHSENGYLVCPFFVVGDLAHNVEAIDVTEEKWDGELKITDARYSLFEIMILETTGRFSWVILRKGNLRGEFHIGQTVQVSGTLCRITEGALKGEKAVFVDIEGSIKNLHNN